MKNFWKTFWEAIHGAPRDYTEGPVGKAVILLGIPMVLEMVMESVFVITDIFFVGKLGPQAIATIGLTESLLTIVYTVAFGLSIGATAMMARRVGEQDLEGAAKTAVQTVALGAVVSVLIGSLGVVFAPDLLRLMGATPELIEYGHGYTRIMFGGNLSILLLFLGNAIFRGAGDGTIAMRALWISNGLNVVFRFPKSFMTNGADSWTALPCEVAIRRPSIFKMTSTGNSSSLWRRFSSTRDFCICARATSRTSSVFWPRSAFSPPDKRTRSFGSCAKGGRITPFRI
jgi:hypothetical protein